jgi:hypothetical protein
MAYASNRSSQSSFNENEIIQLANSAETSRAEIEVLNINDENPNPVNSASNRTVELDSNDETNANRSIVEETDEENENDDVDDYEQEYASKAKMPRLGSITNLKDHQKENENKNQEPENDEDVY